MKNKIFRLAFRMLNSWEDAEEAVQEVFIKVWQSKHNLRPDSNIEGYAMTVARNHCLDKFKSKHYKHRGASIDDFDLDIHFETQITAPDKDTEYKNAHELIEKILLDLPERWRTIVQLRDVEGYSNPEVAQMLGIDENVVKVTLSRVRKRLREILINKYKYNYNEN